MSVARGLVISGILIMVLPVLTGADSPVVCYAGHGAADHDLYGYSHSEIYECLA